MKYKERFKTELEIAHRINYKYKFKEPYERENINASSAIFNCRYNLLDLKGFMPYLSVGLGFSFIKAGDIYEGSTNETYKGNIKNNLARQLGAGIEHKLSNKVSLELVYRYTYLGNCSVIDTVVLSKNAPTNRVDIKRLFRAHGTLFGMIYRF